MKNQGVIIRRLQVTEKGSALAEAQRKYFFVVTPTANKRTIKQAVEDLYKVKVEAVNTMRYLGKNRRERTPQFGKRPDWKRAVVTLRTGDQIDLT